MAVYTRQQNRLAMLDGRADGRETPDADFESGQDGEFSTCSLDAALMDDPPSSEELARFSSIGSMGLSGICLPRTLRYQFAKESMETTYQAYFNRQRRDTLHILVLFAFLFDMQGLILYLVDSPEKRLMAIAIMGMGAIASLVLFCLCKYKLLTEWAMKYIIPYTIWALLCGQTYADLLLYYHPLTPSDGVGWQVFFVFASFAMMPLRLSVIVVLCGCTIFVHSMIVGLKSDANTQHMGNQVSYVFV